MSTNKHKNRNAQRKSNYDQHLPKKQLGTSPPEVPMAADEKDVKDMLEGFQRAMYYNYMVETTVQTQLAIEHCINDATKERAAVVCHSQARVGTDTPIAEGSNATISSIFQVVLSNKGKFHMVSDEGPLQMGIFVPDQALSLNFDTTLPATITQTFPALCYSPDNDVTECLVGPTITFMPHGCKFARPILVFLNIPDELIDTSGRYEYAVLYSDTTDEDPFVCEWDELSFYEEGHVSGVVLPEQGLAILSLNHFCKFTFLRRKKVRAIEIQVFSDYDDRAHEIKLACLICPESVEDKIYENAKKKIEGQPIKHHKTVVHVEKCDIQLSIGKIGGPWEIDDDESKQTVPHKLVWDGSFPSREFVFKGDPTERLTCTLTLTQGSRLTDTIKLRANPEITRATSLSPTYSSLGESTLSSATGFSFTARSESETSMSQPANTGSTTSPTKEKAVNAQDLCESIEQLPYNEMEKKEAYNCLEQFKEATRVDHPYHDIFLVLISDMDPTPVLDRLNDLKYITKEKRQEIGKESTQTNQSRCIFFDVLSRVPFEDFCTILEESSQCHLASQIRDILARKDEPK